MSGVLIGVVPETPNPVDPFRVVTAECRCLNNWRTVRKAPHGRHSVLCYNQPCSTPKWFLYRQIAGYPRFPNDKHPSLGVPYAVKPRPACIHCQPGDRLWRFPA